MVFVQAIEFLIFLGNDLIIWGNDLIFWGTPMSSLVGEGNGNPLHCSCLENPRDGGAWWAAIYGVTKSRTRLKWLSRSSSSLVVKNLPAKQEKWIWSLGQEDPLEKEMATHSSSLVWVIWWREDHDELPYMGLQRVGYIGCLCDFFHWRLLKWKVILVNPSCQGRGRTERKVLKLRRLWEALSNCGYSAWSSYSEDL